MAAMLASAYWTVAEGRGELRSAHLRAPGDGEVLVRTLRSGVSRGTETLVHRGQVPAEVAETMRAPFQEGDFPWPVKYGYLSVGVVEVGPADLVGRRVFCLFPHQDRYVVPASAVTVLPEAVPTDRAVLAGTVETAVNAVWDASPRYGDRVAVVGLGMVGAATAALLRDFPLQRLQVVETDPAKRELAARLGVRLVTPAQAGEDCDIVVHCSATEQGLATALRLAGDDADVVELSWYGRHSPRVPLGAGFHARRLTLRASQVGAVSPVRRARRSLPERMQSALAALTDDRFDALLGATHPFTDLPAVLDELAAGPLPGLCHLIRYPDRGA